MKKKLLLLLGMSFGAAAILQYKKHPNDPIADAPASLGIVSQKKDLPSKPSVQSNRTKPTDAQENADSDQIPDAHLVKQDEHGTRVYQLEGMQITVSKDGELFFLPEKI